MEKWRQSSEAICLDALPPHPPHPQLISSQDGFKLESADGRDMGLNEPFGCREERREGRQGHVSIMASMEAAISRGDSGWTQMG